MKKITIKGKEYPCRITMGAMVRFKRESGKDVSEISKSDVSDLVLFLWCIVKAACAADELEFPYSFESFADHLEPGDISGFYDSMSEAQKKTMDPEKS